MFAVGYTDKNALLGWAQLTLAALIYKAPTPSSNDEMAHFVPTWNLIFLAYVVRLNCLCSLYFSGSSSLRLARQAAQAQE